jgi:hypothetical protein
MPRQKAIAFKGISILVKKEREHKKEDQKDKKFQR